MKVNYKCSLCIDIRLLRPAKDTMYMVKFTYEKERQIYGIWKND